MGDTVTLPKAQAEVQAKSFALLDTLLRNPKTARTVEDQIRQVSPDAQFPARDLAESYLAPHLERLTAAEADAKAARAELAADRAEREQAALTDKYTRRLDTAQKKYGFDDAARDQVLQRMRDNNSPDVEAAAAFVNESIPKPPPMNRSIADGFVPAKVDLYGSQSKDKAWENLHANPDKFFDDEVRAIMSDPALAA